MGSLGRKTRKSAWRLYQVHILKMYVECSHFVVSLRFYLFIFLFHSTSETHWRMSCIKGRNSWLTIFSAHNISFYKCWTLNYLNWFYGLWADKCSKRKIYRKHLWIFILKILYLDVFNKNLIMLYFTRILFLYHRKWL